jgi:drug/metabolite transporter (DMT)-like permease
MSVAQLASAPRSRLAPLDIALYAALVFAWGFSWIAMHYQVGTVDPEVSVVWRFLIAAPVMLAIAAWRGERLRFAASDHLWFALLGVTLFCTNFTLFYYAALWVASGLLAVVFSLASVINVWLGALVLGTPVDRRVVIGGVLGVFGVAAMFQPQFVGTELGSGALIGVALAFAGTLSFCFGNMISARLQQRAIPVFAASGWGMIYGAAALAAYAFFRGQAFVIDPSWPYLAGLIYLALLGSVVAFACYLTLLGRIGADRAAYSTVMFPVVALLVSTAFEGYRWTLPALLGLVAVLAGNLLVLRPHRTR